MDYKALEDKAESAAEFLEDDGIRAAPAVDVSCAGRRTFRRRTGRKDRHAHADRLAATRACSTRAGPGLQAPGAKAPRGSITGSYCKRTGQRHHGHALQAFLCRHGPAGEAKHLETGIWTRNKFALQKAKWRSYRIMPWHKRSWRLLDCDPFWVTKSPHLGGI